MGSLSMFGELISQETGIRIKDIDMVTTLIALEAARKASVGSDIDEIYNEIIHKHLFSINYSNDIYDKLDSSKLNVVITMCLTGEGSTVKLKNIVEEQLYITVTINGKQGNAKSILGILALGITEGSSITITTDGEDENEAVDTLIKLIESGFGEN